MRMANLHYQGKLKPLNPQNIEIIALNDSGETWLYMVSTSHFLIDETVEEALAEINAALRDDVSHADIEGHVRAYHFQVYRSEEEP